MFKFLFLCLLISVSCFARNLDDIEVIVNESLKEFNVPGVAIGVLQDHEIIFAKGFGYRNLENGLPVTEKTLFTVASCTKAFTSLLIGQLEEQGLLSWDDPVIKHIPEFQLFDPNLTREVTLRDLSAHRTGIPRHDAIWFCSETFSRKDVLKCLPYLEPMCALREKFHYSNFMYAVMGIVVERVTGLAWEEALYRYILKPLNMLDSNLSVEELQQTTNYSLPYAEIEGEITALPFHKYHSVAPAGSLNSNVVDMLKWVDLQLFSEKLVRGATLDEMHTIQMPFFGNEILDLDGTKTFGYGLGWFVGDYKGHSIIHHGGCIDGFAADVAFLKGKNIGIVLLTNSSSDGSYVITTIRNTIFDRLLDETETDWMHCCKEIRKVIKALLIDDETEKSTPSRPLDEYVGSYEHPAYGKLAVTEENGILVAHYGPHPIFLKYQQDNLFKGKIFSLLYFSIKWLPDFSFSETNGQIAEVHVSFEPTPGSKPIIFKKVPTIEN